MKVLEIVQFVFSVILCVIAGIMFVAQTILTWNIAISIMFFILWVGIAEMTYMSWKELTSEED